jgi:hypothetical protein
MWKKYGNINDVLLLLPKFRMVVASEILWLLKFRGGCGLGMIVIVLCQQHHNI